MRMIRSLYSKIVMVTALVCVLCTLIGWRSERKPEVTVEPLSCFEQSNKVVCFDVPVHQVTRCESLVEDHVLCTADQQ